MRAPSGRQRRDERDGAQRCPGGAYDHGTMTMVMSERIVTASSFKAHCLAMLDEVAATGQQIVITKRGCPVARVVAVNEPEDLAGSVTYHVSDEELIAPLDERWDAWTD